MQSATNQSGLFPKLTRWFESRAGKIAVNLILFGLLVLTLILPPVSLLERLQTQGYTSVPAEGGSVVDPDGTSLTIPAEGRAKGGNLQVRLNATPRQIFMAGEAGNALRVAAEKLPGSLDPRSPVYTADLRGEKPGLAVLRVPIPNDSEPYNTLGLYEFDSAAGIWKFVPNQIVAEDDAIEAHLNNVPQTFMVMQTKPQPSVAAAQVTAENLLPAEGKGALAEVNPTGLQLAGDGGIEGSLQGLPTDQASAFAVVPSLRNFGSDGVIRTDLIANLLVSPDVQQKHIDAIAQLVVGNSYRGIELDYRGIDANLATEYASFIQKLAAKLHTENKTIAVRVEEPRQVSQDQWDTGPYNWRELGAAVDTFRIPASTDPTTYGPDAYMHTLLNWAVGEVDRNKIQLILVGRSIEKSGNYFLPKSYQEALQPLLGQVQADKDVIAPGEQVDLKLLAERATSQLVFDESIGSYVYRYRDEQGFERTVWLENAASLSHKLKFVSQYHLQGATFDYLPASDPDLWKMLTTYQQGEPTASKSEFAVQWTVKDPNGQVADSASQPLGQNNAYPFKAPDKPGEKFNVAAEVLENGRSVGSLGEVALLVATYTPTAVPTKVPTATPRPTATPAATKAPAKAAAPAAPPPVRGSSADFGYGVQAQVYGGADLGYVASATRGMGFNWVKFQVPWKDFEGQKGNYGWGGMDDIVNSLSGSGLKILASIVKAPNWARNPAYGYSDEGPPQNPQDYADFVGAYAGRYCGRVQAIEVWNEQNLHYEWGNEPLDANRYVELLRLAYRAIKAACPSMVVVSGAPTPAGNVPGKAIDDVEYLQAMYRAGLRGVSDAIGSHPSGYNCPADGDWRTVSDPSASFRGPFDNRHHSWCFRGTMESYRNVMLANGDGGKRIWPTEFGWAVGPAFSNAYGYANDNTAEEQAEWLVRAYQIARGWGWVGPMFLWNLNFGITNPGTELAQFGIAGRPAYDALARMPK